MTTDTKPKLTLNDLSPELRREALELKCNQDFPWFLYEYGIVTIREIGIRPFKEEMWPFQWDFAALLQREPRLIILKARQTGISTITMHFLYHSIRFGPPNSQHALVLSKSKEDAAYLLEKISEIHKSVIAQSPELAMEVDADNTFSFELANKNKIECLAATKSAGRSRAATIIVLDEYAFHQYAKENYAALKPTLEGGGKVIIISTGNGTGNEYHRQYQMAREQKSPFTAVFIPYNAVPHRTKEWYEKEQQDYPEIDKFYQEYPQNDAEAFTKTGSSPFDQEWVIEQLKIADAEDKLRAPIRLCDGRIRIWEKPRPSMLYAAGLDCAQGIGQSGNPDNTSLKILDRYGKMVAAWDGRLELTEAAPEIAQLLLMYRPFLCVERNAAGAGFIPALQAHGVKNFYRFEKRHIMPDAPDDKKPLIGITLTPTIKSVLVGNLITYINTHALQSVDPKFWREVSTFVQTGPTKWGALGGYKDDMVLATCHALWALTHYPRSKQRRKAKKVRWH